MGESLGCLSLRDGDRFAIGFEYGVTLAMGCRVLPLEPDDFAFAGVVIQSNPASERTHNAEPPPGRRCVRWSWAVVDRARPW